MAATTNEMFTTRSGRQVAVPTITIPKSEVVSLMRLQEDFTARGEHLSMLGVLLDVLDKGTRQVRNQWKNVDKAKDNRKFAEAIAPFMADPVTNAAEITRIATLYGKIKGTPVELSAKPEPEPEPELEPELELTEEQLEAATTPDGAN